MDDFQLTRSDKITCAVCIAIGVAIALLGADTLLSGRLLATVLRQGRQLADETEAHLAAQAGGRE
jgi:hypothetical protein